MNQRYRSFSDPDTHFRLVRSDTPVSVDGHKIGEPTGEVECEDCGRVAAAPEYIPHAPGCDQKNVLSDYFAETHPNFCADD